MRRILLSLLLLLASLIPASAQQAGTTPVQNTGSRLDACTSVAYATAAVNNQVTATIPAQAGMYAYICSISADVCANGTGGTVITNGNFTSTNLPSTPTWQVSFAGTANTCANPGVRETFNGPPLKSNVPGTAVTVVSPAAGAQNSYTIRMTYYYAP